MTYFVYTNLFSIIFSPFLFFSQQYNYVLSSVIQLWSREYFETEVRGRQLTYIQWKNGDVSESLSSFKIKNKFNHGNGVAIHQFVFDHAQNAEKSLNRYFKSWKTKKNCSRSNKKRKNRQGKFLVCTYKSHKWQKSFAGLHSNSIYMIWMILVRKRLKFHVESVGS